MKKWIKKVITGTIILSSSIGFVGCGLFNSNSKEEGYVFKNYEEKYYVNDNFSIVGTKLLITDSKGDTEEISVTADMIKHMPDMSTPGEKTVVIEYNGVEYSFTIMIESRTNEQLMAKLKKFLKDYENASNTSIETRLKTNLIAKYLGDEANIDEQEKMKLIGEMFKDDALLNVLYNSAVNGVVDASFNLDENLIVNSDEYKAKLDTLKVFETIKSDIQNFDLRTYLIDLMLQHEDIYYINTASDYINTVCEIKSVTGKKAIKDIVNTYYFKLKNFESFELVDAYTELLEKINTHSVNPVIKEATKDLKTLDQETILHIPSKLTETQWLNYGHVVTAENFEQKIINRTDFNYERGEIATSLINQKAQAEKELAYAIENAVIDLVTCGSEEELESIVLNCLKASENYSQAMIDSYTLQRDNNVLIVMVDSQGDYSTEIYWDSEYGFDYDSAINNFVSSHDEFQKYYNDINDYGFIGTVEQNALVEELFANFEYPEEDKQQAIDNIYAILNSELEGEDLYWAIADVLFPNSANEYIGEVKNIVKSYLNNGLIHAIEENQLVEMLFDYLANYPEEYKQQAIDTVYSILKEQKIGKELYLDIVNILTPKENEYYIDLVCNTINEYLSIESVTGQNEIRELITTYFENLKTATEFDVKAAYSEILTAINVHSTDEIVKVATANLESLDIEKMSHIISDIIYTDALENTRIATTGITDRVDYDYQIINSQETQDLVEKYATNARNQIYSNEKAILSLLTVEKPEDLFDIALNWLKEQENYYAEEITIVEILDANKWCLGEEVISTSFDGNEYHSFTRFQNWYYLDKNPVWNNEDWCWEYHWEGYEKELTWLNDEKQYYADLHQQVDLIQSLIFEPEQAVNNLISDYKTDIINASLKLAENYLGVESGSMMAYDLEQLFSDSIDGYLNNNFDKEECLKSIEQIINDYATDETKTIVKVGYLLYNALNYDETIDYNEVFKDIELPNQVESVDYNKLMSKVMDQETYEIFKFNDIEIKYITDDSNNIIGEQLILKVDVNFDVMIASLKGEIEFSCELYFEPENN